MGCCGDREKQANLRNDVKWEYVNLDEFKIKSCWTPFAYVYLWLMMFVSVSVYAVDTFTAINLLAFNKWSGSVQPELKLNISKWIFAGCIMLSFLLLAYRWWRAIRVMKGGKVAKSYLDPLAVRVQSIRMGQEGRGFRRFLVFAELTKSRKGADYVALFAYYSFEAWLRIVFAEGPRQGVNGYTLYKVMQANLIPAGSHAAPVGESPFVQFWKNVGILADENKFQAVILFSMLWTLLIWVISAISLALSVVLYLIFLWHHIPSEDKGLTGYCRKKINRRMERIVKAKTEKALRKENEIRAREEARALREGRSDIKRQPTLPDLSSVASSATDSPAMPPLSRTATMTTMSTLPEYSSRPGTGRPSEDALPPMPTPPEATGRPGRGRHNTKASDASWSSYNSNAPLMDTAGDMGYSPVDRIQTPSSAVSVPWSARSGPYRNFNSGSSRPPTAQSGRVTPGSYQMETFHRSNTSGSHGPRPLRLSTETDTLPPTQRGQTPTSAHPSSATSTTHAPHWPDNQGRRTPATSVNPYLPPISPIPEARGRESPAPQPFARQESVRSYASQPVPQLTSMHSLTPIEHRPTPPPKIPPPFSSIPASMASTNTSSPGYVAFSPSQAYSSSPVHMYPPMPMPMPNNGERRGYGRPNMLPAELDAQPSSSIAELDSRPYSRQGQSRGYGYGHGQGYSQAHGHLYGQHDDSNTIPKPPPERGGSFDDILNHY